MATLTVFGPALDHLTDADFDWLADAVYVSLHTASYTPDQDAHDYADDLTGEVGNGSGYTTGGTVLANKTRTYDAGTKTVTLDADDVAWPNATFSYRYAVLRKVRGGAASADELIGYVDTGGDQQATNAVVNVAWNPAGIIEVSTP